VSSDRTVTISARYAGVTKTTTLTVRRARTRESTDRPPLPPPTREIGCRRQGFEGIPEPGRRERRYRPSV
jgi:hypothetical protein